MPKLTAPPELCTALTNLLTAAVAFCFVFAHRKHHGERALQGRLWNGLMFSIGLSSLVGFAAHLVRWPERASFGIWAFLAPLLCAAASLFLLCGLCGQGDEHRLRAFSRKLCYAWGVVSVCILAAIRWWGHFLPIVILYAAVCLVWGVLFFRRYGTGAGPGSRYWLAALAAQAVGGVVLATRRLTFMLVWQFDYNSVYHLATLLSICLFWRGYTLKERAYTQG